MILSTHALVGAAIGKNIPNPWLVIILSLIVHYILDGFRHGEYLDIRKDKFKDMYWKVLIDLGIGYTVIVAFVIFSSPEPPMLINIILGTLFSQFPDLLTLLHRYLPNNKLLILFRNFHGWAHRYNKNPKYSPERQWTKRNVVNDIFISMIATLILFL